MIRILTILSFVGILLVLPYGHVSGIVQEMQPYSIGDSVQSLQLKGLSRAGDLMVDLDDYRGKGLILDFGSTGCPPCVESLKELSDMLRIFPNELQVLSVMKDKKSRVSKFLLESPVGTQLPFPVLYEDTLLHNLFPHYGQPHLVWIDKKGIVQAFTNHHYITQDYIKVFLAGKPLEFSVKQDFAYNPENLLLVLNPETIRHEMIPSSYRSIYISNYMPGVRRSYRVEEDSIRGQIRVQAINQNLTMLYLKLLANKYSLLPNHLVTHGVDPGKFMYSRPLHGPRLEWDIKNLYCFEMYFPITLSEDERNKRIANYLDDYLNISTSYQTVERTVWVVSAPRKVKQEGVEKGFMMRDLLQIINNTPNHPPLQFDEHSLMSGNDFFYASLVLDSNRIFDFDYLSRILREHGYELRQEQRMIEGLNVTAR